MPQLEQITPHEVNYTFVKGWLLCIHMLRFINNLYRPKGKEIKILKEGKTLIIPKEVCLK